MTAMRSLDPDEDRRLLRSAKVPLCYRLLWGFFMREGAREGEVLGFTIGDFDLVRGAVRLDKEQDRRPASVGPFPGRGRGPDALPRALLA